MSLTPPGWLALLTSFTALPSALIIARTIVDVMHFRRHGYTQHGIVGTLCAVAAWISLLIAAGMAYWRNARLGGIAAGSPAGRSMMTEATVMHSLVVPTGLWLVKGSFVAMYYKMSRHLSRPFRILLHGNVLYLFVTYLTQILTHTLWCSTYVRVASPRCTPFSDTFPISLYALLNITSDLLVMITPILFMRKISFLARAIRGIAFLGFLGLGMVATAATCCYFHLVLKDQFASNWEFTKMAELLTIIELSTGLMAVALPTLRAVTRSKRDRRDNRGPVMASFREPMARVVVEEGHIRKLGQRESRVESEAESVPLSPWEVRETRRLMSGKSGRYAGEGLELMERTFVPRCELPMQTIRRV